MMAGRIIIAQHHTHRNGPISMAIALSREPISLAHKTRFASSSSSKSNKQNTHGSVGVDDSTPPSTTPTRAATSKIKQLFDSLTSTASDSASRAATTATQAARTAATDSLRHSLTNAKIDAREAGGRYAREARRSMVRLGEDAKRSANAAARTTSGRVKDSISEASRSASDRLRSEISQRIPETSPRILESASRIASGTVTKKVSETVGKATRWFWWWGLAAVGVYGMSTTLTKEGMQMIKEVVTPSSKESPSVVNTTAPHVASIPDDARAKNSAVASADERRNASIGLGGWLSSWFPYTGKPRQERDSEDEQS
mmetsp:Transcript_6720/g.16547  ORF Transcript_6720/g.16547 Transcript_6720/m.16547 type:complete len:314 (-) Transcript_6720:357-1298(-)